MSVGLYFEIHASDARPIVAWSVTPNAWRATFSVRDHTGQASASFSIDYFTGPGIEGEPTIADVLECVLADAQSFYNARDILDFVDELGIENHEHARAMYEACGRTAKNLQRVLGLKEFENAMEDADAWMVQHGFKPDENACTTCGAPTDDGEGYDGLCGTCADRAEVTS